jgi:CDP-glucose 4,6-dehydratase
MSCFAEAYRGRRVLVTGHTGFKGSWLCEWLLLLGADVTGFSLGPPTNPSLFKQLNLENRIRHIEGDVRNRKQVASVIKKIKPEFLFHMAAQSLVFQSYEFPVETFSVNTIGTIHVLDALKDFHKHCAAIFITTDKCYENHELGTGFKEEDPLGGRDIYSSSKAAAEISISAYRNSFFRNHSVKVSSVRAGNAIGGGDWAANRIIPDCMRSLQKDLPIKIRNPKSTRPWQHVLEPLSGYLWLGALLSEPRTTKSKLQQLETAFNFGPTRQAHRSVKDLVIEILKHWPGKWKRGRKLHSTHESKYLHLNIKKANLLLGWFPVWDFKTTIFETVNWYRELNRERSSEKIHIFTIGQIEKYVNEAERLKLPWTLK